MLTIALLLVGCGGRARPTTLEPAAAAEAIAATAPDRPLRVVFEWTMLDGEARFTGSGAARIEPPYRARLDLFGPRGEAYASAAVVDADVRLPPGTRNVPLPPAAMMWALLGVVRPPDQAVLAATERRDDRTVLYYVVDDGRLRYTLAGRRLVAARWDHGGRMDVELGPARSGIPARAAYRDWSGHTELIMNLEQVDEVESFPTDIWNPGA
ncbi:MAG: hypothetical protein ACOCVZ_03780 [Gemmatimonadota bacterium]